MDAKYLYFQGFRHRLSSSENVYASIYVYQLAGLDKCMHVTNNTNIKSR